MNKSKKKRKIRNYWIRFLIIWILFGGAGIYLILINQVMEGIISFAVGLMFTGLNNLIRI